MKCTVFSLVQTLLLGPTVQESPRGKVQVHSVNLKKKSKKFHFDFHDFTLALRSKSLLDNFPSGNVICTTVICNTVICTTIICTTVICTTVICTTVICTTVICTTVICTTVICTTVICTTVKCTTVICTTVICTTVICTTVICTTVICSTVKNSKKIHFDFHDFSLALRSKSLFS
jgi:hypothetical protein